jgi:hypothetical protein
MKVPTDILGGSQDAAWLSFCYCIEPQGRREPFFNPPGQKIHPAIGFVGSDLAGQEEKIFRCPSRGFPWSPGKIRFALGGSN